MGNEWVTGGIFTGKDLAQCTLGTEPFLGQDVRSTFTLPSSDCYRFHLSTIKFSLQELSWWFNFAGKLLTELSGPLRGLSDSPA